MSSSSSSLSDSGVSAAVSKSQLHDAAPRLTPGSNGGYAAWRPLIVHYMASKGIHREDYMEAIPEWDALSKLLSVSVKEESAERRARVLASLGGAVPGAGSPVQGASASASASTSSAPVVVKKGAPNGDLKDTQDEIQRIRRACAILFKALPADVQLLVRSLPEGYAFALWNFLERKYQSTEADNVGTHWAEWSTLSQRDGESFDTYKARVDELRTLLGHAQEKVSESQYASTLLDRLRPLYKPAGLALKMGGLLRATPIDWVEVVRQVNAHERAESSAAADNGDAAQVLELRMPPRTQRPSNGGRPFRGKKDMKNEECFRCHKKGHYARDCPAAAPVGAGGPRTGGGASSHESRAPSGGAHSVKQQRDASESDGDDSPRAAAAGRLNSIRGEVAATPQDKKTITYKQALTNGNDCEAAQVYGLKQTPAEWIRDTGAVLVEKMVVIQKAIDHLSRLQASALAAAPAADRRPRPASPVPAGPRASSSSWTLVKTREQVQSVHRGGASSHRVTDHKQQPSTKVAPAQVVTTSDSIRHEFGVDTCASSHVSGSKDHFIALNKCDAIRMEVADGAVVSPSSRGSVVVHVPVAGDAKGKTVRLVFNNVYYHKSFGHSLLSWGVLRAQGWTMHSDAGGSHLLTPSGTKIALSDTGRVLTLNGSVTVGERVLGVLGAVSCASVKDLVDLHARLGHMSFGRMVHVMKGGATMDIGKLAVSREGLEEARQQIMECKACCQGKGTRSPRQHRGLDRGELPMSVLHMDTYHVKHPGPDGKVEYGLAVKDAFSSYRWSQAVTSKDEVAREVIAIVRNAETQTGRKVKRLLTDGGSEFHNATLKNFCKREGMELLCAPADNPDLNGVAEREVRISKDGTRTLLLHCGLAQRFWSYALYHHTATWNRTHVSDKTGQTPWQLIKGRQPSMKEIHAFGSDCFVHIPKRDRDGTFTPKMEPGIYLGMDHRGQGGNVFLLQSRKVVRSNDLDVRDNKYRHAAALEQGGDAVQGVLDAGFYEAEPAESEDNLKQDEALAQQEEKHFAEDGEELPAGEYEVEEIIGRRKRGAVTEYKVLWKGFPIDQSSWEPAARLGEAAQEAIDEYEEQQRAQADGRRRERREEALAAPVGEALEAQPDAAAAVEPAVAPASVPRPGAASVVPEAVAAAAAAAVSADRPDADSPPARRTRSRYKNNALNDETSDMVHMVMSAMGTPLDVSSQSGVESTRPDYQDRLEQAFAVAAGVGLMDGKTPQSHYEALRHPDSEQWLDAEDDQIAACVALDTWSLVPRSSLPKGANVLPGKWVYKIKVDEHGVETQKKARITPKGYKQKHGVDYYGTYARTGMAKTMRVMLSLGARYDYESCQLDVPTAFCKADVEEEIYMEVPEGRYREGKEHLVCKLKKALYGLKQAPRNWWLLVREFIIKQMGFLATVSDPNLFIRRSATGRIMFLYLWVDDFQVFFHAADASEWKEQKAKLVERFAAKDMGPAKWILGMLISRDRQARTIKLDQEVYVTKALEKFGLADCRTHAIPAETGNAVESDEDGGGAPADLYRYMEIVGTLLYAAVTTRVDIAYAVHTLTRHTKDPKQRHMKMAERVLRYLASQKDTGLVFGEQSVGTVTTAAGIKADQHKLTAWCDADYANDRTDRKSITGWIVKLNGDVVSWRCKKQHTVSQSTCEAELYASAAAMNELQWLRGLLRELELAVAGPATVYCDNQSTKSVIENGICSERTKHVDVKYHFTTELVERGLVVVVWVPTLSNQADMLTKALARPQFATLRKLLMSA